MSLSLFDLLNITCNSLKGNPLRSTLTTVGVFMGVAAVSATLQVSNISRAVISEQLAKRDAPQVVLYGYGRDPVSGEYVQLRMEDFDFLQRRLRLSGLRAISAANGGDQPQTVFQSQQANPNPTRIAVSQDFLLTSGRQLLAGRFFTPADFENFQPVVVINQFLADRLFKKANPRGERIYVDRRPYVVVGVLPTQIEEDGQEGLLLIPMSVYTSLTGDRSIRYILMRPYSMKDLGILEKQANELLQQRFPGKKFWTGTNVRKIVEQQKTLEMVSQALLAVGIIALLVGGVGIANISIASVMERTKEIGLRRAIGARQQDILLQFILEAVLLSLLGGISAIGAVHGLTVVVAATFKLHYQFEVTTAALSLGSAILVGVGAGFLPALRASQIDPVKALRSQ
jgi:putative ABC transport system permease protein